MSVESGKSLINAGISFFYRNILGICSPADF